MIQYPQRLRHDTPAWVRDGSLFHIRIRIDVGESRPLTVGGRADELLAAAKRYHELRHWWCELFLLMPDHLHALIRFPREPGMSVTVKNWKRGTARFQCVDWQEGFFDYRIRSEAEAREKWAYIRRNPVVKELCQHEDDWPHWLSATLEGGTR